MMDIPIPTTTRIASPEFELYCEDGPDAQWIVTAIEIEEQLDRPYRAEVELWNDCGEFDSFLGASCELVFLRDTERRRLYGVVAELELLGQRGHQLGARLVILPAFALLEHGCSSNIWQQRTVQQILSELLDRELGAYGREFDLGGVERGDCLREYCVQYRESVAAFCARLLAEEGICYRFEHGEDRAHELLVLHDHPKSWPELDNVDGCAEVPIIRDHPEQASVESIQTLVPAQRLRVTAIQRRDFDWQHPLELMTSSVGGIDDRGRVRRAYTHGGRRVHGDDLDLRAHDDLERSSSDTSTLRGAGNVMSFMPGSRFYLASGDELEGEYLITRVRHQATRDEQVGYRNLFDCVAADVSLRPPARAKPKVHGPQTAIVVGDDEIRTDSHGRVQVQFHWEPEPSYAAGASCWVRCAQSWAGAGWGAQFIPRVGMEVMIEFLEGDPDQPLVTGCVYNGDNGVPFTLPNDKTQSGWITRSVPGGLGYNMLRFEDTAGFESIVLRAQRDWETIALHDASHLVMHERQLIVGLDDSERVGRNRNVVVGEDLTLEIGGSRQVGVEDSQGVVIGHDAREQIGGSKTVELGGHYSISVGETGIVNVGKSLLESIGADRTLIIDGASVETITEGKSVTAKSVEQTIEQHLTIEAGGKLRISSDESFSLTGKKKGLVEATKRLVLRCGKASITLEKNGDIKLEGKAITLTGKGKIKLEGKKVDIN